MVLLNLMGGFLSSHYPRKKKRIFLHEYKESHTPKSIKDP